MNATTSGVCLVRVEVQSGGTRYTVIPDYHDGSGWPPPQEFRDLEEALSTVREFLSRFGHDGWCPHVC